MSVANVESVEAFKPSGQSAVLFVASFHEACKPGGQMDAVFGLLAKNNPSVSFYKVDAEELSDIAEEFDVEVVPTVVLLKDRKPVEKVEGAHPAKLTERLENFVSTAKSAAGPATSVKPVFKRIEDLLASNYIFLFIKGTPDNAKCKFSKKILGFLSEAGVKNFGSFDVLSDESIRQGLKEYSNWPTFPQVFAGGKLVGGVDIIEELAKDGDLAAALTPSVEAVASSTAAQTQAKKPSLEERLEKLINKAPVMLFMKGSPSAPECGFSSQIVSILKDQAIEFNTFDILTDDAVRQGLKTYSEWPTFPQLYAGGKLIGGLDIVRDLLEDGSLVDALNM